MDRIVKQPAQVFKPSDFHIQPFHKGFKVYINKPIIGIIDRWIPVTELVNGVERDLYFADIMDAFRFVHNIG